MPVAIAVTPESFDTATGTELSFCVPLPSSPWTFHPQHFTEVSERSAHEFNPPATIATADVEDFAGVTDVETCVGVVVSTAWSDTELLHAARLPNKAAMRREDLSRRFMRQTVPALIRQSQVSGPYG